MNLFQAFFLGVLQGATEFLPVSSSGHLVLVPWLFRWDAASLAFDAFVHWGTALAVLVYFWRDWVSIVGAAVRSLSLALRRLPEMWQRGRARAGEGASGLESGAERALDPELGGRGFRAPTDGLGRRASHHAGLAWLIVLGTVPAALIGYLWEDFFAAMFARPPVAAAFLLVTAALLTATERLGRRTRDLDQITWVDALFVGLGQALAILPGISRSGATIAAGLARGLRREPAARFSFLLATPIIFGAGLFKMVDLAQGGDLATQIPALAVGFVSAGVVGFVCIHFLLQYLQRRRLYPFAIYCAVAGIFCLLVALLRGA